VLVGSRGKQGCPRSTGSLSCRCNSGERNLGDSRALDCYCCFYWLGHFEGFVAWDFHLVDFLGVELDMSDDLVVCLCSDHEAAIAVYLFRHFLPLLMRFMFLIR